MGRQTVAGFNPFTIKIATMDLFKGISKITAEDLHGVPLLNSRAFAEDKCERAGCSLGIMSSRLRAVALQCT